MQTETTYTKKCIAEDTKIHRTKVILDGLTIYLNE